MHHRSPVRAVLPLLSLTLVAGLQPASAEVGASGTRLILPGGKARSYMTYGHVDELELYAPLLPELKRLGITMRERGQNYDVFYGARRVAEWQIVRSRENVPETAEDPYVLVLGGNVYVPVRALAQRFSLDVKFTKKDNLLALTPLPVKPQPNAPKTAALPPARGPVTLPGVEVRQSQNGLEVRVRSSGPITPTWNTVKSPSPVRILLDFPNAHWADGVQLPAGLGDVREVRIGHPDPSTARLVLEVPSLQTKFTSIVVGADDVRAMVGRGAPVKVATLDPETQKILDALNSRRNPSLTASSRGDDLEGGIILIDPNLPPLVPVDPPKPLIERLSPLVVSPATSLVGKTIVVDAGHGGHDVGAKGADHVEKDLCLQLCHQLARELEARGARVVMTRPSDTFVSLESRCAIANGANADLFVSIHLNSTPTRNSATGTETYWHTPKSQRLARALHRRVVNVVGSLDRGIRNRRFYVVRNTEMPSVLLEVGFINNRSDEALIAQGLFQSRLAESLTLGVLDYFGTDLQGSSK
ncbi:MAG: N-acetylmuramoyl-L-alanine amidase [Actinomycetota bacterium]